MFIARRSDSQVSVYASRDDAAAIVLTHIAGGFPPTPEFIEEVEHGGEELTIAEIIKQHPEFWQMSNWSAAAVEVFTDYLEGK